MASVYPSALDSLNTTHQDSVGELIHAADINNIADAVDKIEAELGILPKGTFSSVSAKLGSLFYGSIANPATLTAGNRPKGLIVYNTTNNRYEFNSGTDAAPVWAPIGGAGPWGPTDLTSAVSVIPVGGVTDWPWAAASVPVWAALPAGQALNRTTFASLFAVANATGLSTYGVGDGSTTFNIPDYRGRIGVGKDDMTGSTANRITLAISGVAGTTLGGIFGSEGMTLTTAQLPAHNHTHTLSISGGSHSHGDTISFADVGHGHGASSNGHSHGYNAVNGAAINYASGGNAGVGIGSTPHPQTDGIGDLGISVGTGTANLSKSGSVAANTHTHSNGEFAGSISNTGSGNVTQNTQPSIIVNKIIRVS